MYFTAVSFTAGALHARGAGEHEVLLEVKASSAFDFRSFVAADSGLYGDRIALGACLTKCKIGPDLRRVKLISDFFFAKKKGL